MNKARKTPGRVIPTSAAAKPRLRRGFTLIELLVVVSIIALLVSILMPALGRAREQARRAVCASNFRQVGTIYHLYANDFNAWLPRGVKEVYEGTAVGDPIDNVVPYILKEYTYQFMKSSYDIPEECWVCPALERNALTTDNQVLDERGELRYTNDGGGQYGFGEYRWIGMALLQGLTNMSVATPETVRQSSLRPSDRGEKLLAADLNIRWEYDWTNRNSRVAHKDGSIPSGANRLAADGSVAWFTNQEMAKNDEPITTKNMLEVEGKYDHKNGGRAYFW